MRVVFPVSITVLFLILGGIPLHLASVPAFGGALALNAIFYWAIHRVELMPSFAVFVIGLLADTTGFAPLGLGALTFLGFYVVARTEVRAMTFASPFVIWINFAILSFLVYFVNWLAVSLMTGVWVNPFPAALCYIIGLLVYPLLTVTLTWADDLMMPED